ncbi:MAG: hypothetical protein AABW63_03360 [Nanoarchaeota archaeon]
MTKTITHQGEGFEFSKSKELYLPTALRKEVDPTLVEQIKSKVRRPLVYGLTALTLGTLPLGTMAQEKAQEKNVSVYSGIVLSEGVSGIVDATYSPLGIRFIAQDDRDEDELNAFRTSLQTGKTFGKLELETSYNTNEPDKEKTHTGIARYSLGKNFLRAGIVSNGLSAGMIGGKLSLENMTLNASLTDFGKHNNLSGYFGASVPLSKDILGYVSFGGQTANDKLFNIVGLDGEGWGAYHFTNIDLKNKEQSGKMLIVPAGTGMGVGFFDVAGEYFTEPDFRGVTDNCAWGWIAPDLFKIDGKTGHSAISLAWENTPKKVDVNSTYWHRWTPSLGAGIKTDFKYDKEKRIWTPTGAVDIYTTIPGTPFDLDVKAKHDFRTGETSSEIYAGASIKF